MLRSMLKWERRRKSSIAEVMDFHLNIIARIVRDQFALIVVSLEISIEDIKSLLETKMLAHFLK